jgi:cell division protein FtsB
MTKKDYASLYLERELLDRRVKAAKKRFERLQAELDAIEAEIEQVKKERSVT